MRIAQLVAVFNKEEQEEPWIGRVECISGNEVQVVWLEGGYGRSWRVARRQDPTNKRKKIDWKDTIPKSSIILYDFELTTTCHLRKKTITHLQKVYQQLRADN